MFDVTRTAFGFAQGPSLNTTFPFGFAQGAVALVMVCKTFQTLQTTTLFKLEAQRKFVGKV
jgi:hypothetical protein